MKKIIFASCVVMIGMMAISGCEKQPLNNLSNEESRIYITNYDSTANFSEYKTFSIVDSVAVVSNTPAEDRELTQSDALLIQKIKDLMQQRGYVLVSKLEDPDLAINVTKVSNTYTGIDVYPGYPGYWGDPLLDGYWDPYYWGYGGYGYYFPSTYYFYQYNEGYVAIDMLDLKNADKNNNQLKAIWNAQFKGENTDAASVVESEVQAAFDQSAYLKSGN